MHPWGTLIRQKQIIQKVGELFHVFNEVLLTFSHKNVLLNTQIPDAVGDTFISSST